MGTFIRFSIPKPRCRSIFGQRWRIYYIPQPPRYSHIHGEYDEDSNIQQQSSNLPSPVAGSMLEGIFLGKLVTSRRPHWIWWLIRGHIPRYPIIIHYYKLHLFPSWKHHWKKMVDPCPSPSHDPDPDSLLMVNPQCHLDSQNGSWKNGRFHHLFMDFSSGLETKDRSHLSIRRAGGSCVSC